MQDRQQAIRVTTLSVFGSLGSSVPNAANSLQSQWQTDAAHDDQTAIWALTTLTRALENQPLVGLVPALNSRDHGHFSDGIKLLMRLFVCRAFSEDGWRRLGNLTGQDKLEIADLWLLHSGAQAASGRDFDLPELAASGITPSDAAPSNRFLHHLMPGLCAGFGAEMKRQITGEMLRQFIDFTVPPQPAEADEEAQIKWERRLAAFVRNRGRTERRRYAVGLAVADEAGASQLASVAIPLGVLPLAYVESARDDCLVAPDEALDLLDALQQCQTALHRLTPSPTHQP